MLFDDPNQPGVVTPTPADTNMPGDPNATSMPSMDMPDGQPGDTGTDTGMPQG
jgi:hypothetical protein